MPDDPPRHKPPHGFGPGFGARPRPVRPPFSGDSVAARRSVLIVLLLGVAAFILAIVLPAIATRIADWLWYRDLGLERVFFTRIVAEWSLGLVTLVVAGAALYGSVRPAVRRSPRVEVLPPELVGLIDSGPPVPAWLPRLTIPVAALGALLMSLVAASQWRTVAFFVNRTPFGSLDPVFGRDIGYYIYTLPLLDLVLNLASAVLMLALIMAVVAYMLQRDIGVRQAGGFYVEGRARNHLVILGAVYFALVALRTHFVSVPSLLLSQHGTLFGANYTDLHARLPAFRIMTVAAIVAAALVLGAARRPRPGRAVALVVAGYVVASILITGIFPALQQRLVVQPNELDREAPQIASHITATRRAWGLEHVGERELVPRPVTAAEIAANRATIDNVRLWDREPLLQTFGQIQAIRTYYDFVSVDDDRYVIDGRLRQVMLSARELNVGSLPTRSFINEHLTYTHGMGVALGPANQVTPEGLPMLFIRDLPPVSTTNVRITRPQIYYGELPGTFVLAPSRQREFDYPSGEGDQAVYSAYTSTHGVKLDAFWRRLVFALRFGSLNVLLSSDLRPDSRILYHRNVLERAQRAFPFLQFDNDPFLVVTDSGALVWMLDAYTWSDRYPYSQPAQDGTNYMRNSVKVTIDAYDGVVRAYLAQPDDPIIRTLQRIYPGVLQPLSAMPADLRRHLRYPQDLFHLQSALFATYHMSDPETFYHREDQWQIPGGEDPDGFIRHMVMRLPGEQNPEFILMRPFTPRQKDNLAAWMVVRNDGAHYGELVAYRFPRQALVFGPQQITSRINQDTEISRQLTLWDQRGSEVIRGELLVLPIEQSLIYVQALYLRSQGGKIPELKRVIVAQETQVAMEESLDAGLARLFGARAAAPDSTRGAAGDTATARVPAATAGVPSEARAALVREALDHYDRARAAQRADDWARYGEEMRQLGEVLRRLGVPPR